MTTTDLMADSNEQQVKDWCLSQMVMNLGLSLFDASSAIAQHVDYHDLENLLKAGCPVTTAIKILANN